MGTVPLVSHCWFRAGSYEYSSSDDASPIQEFVKSSGGSDTMRRQAKARAKARAEKERGKMERAKARAKAARAKARYEAERRARAKKVGAGTNDAWLADWLFGWLFVGRGTTQEQCERRRRRTIFRRVCATTRRRVKRAEWSCLCAHLRVCSSSDDRIQLGPRDNDLPMPKQPSPAVLERRSKK